MEACISVDGYATCVAELPVATHLGPDIECLPAVAVGAGVICINISPKVVVSIEVIFAPQIDMVSISRWITHPFVFVVRIGDVICDYERTHTGPGNVISGNCDETRLLRNLGRVSI